METTLIFKKDIKRVMKMKDKVKKEKKHWVDGNVKMFNGEME